MTNLGNNLQWAFELGSNSLTLCFSASLPEDWPKQIRRRVEVLADLLGIDVDAQALAALEGDVDAFERHRRKIALALGKRSMRLSACFELGVVLMVTVCSRDLALLTDDFESLLFPSLKSAAEAAGVPWHLFDHFRAELANTTVTSDHVIASVLPQTAKSVEARLGQVGRVFLCHASEDKKAVHEIYAKLKHLGHAPWLDTEDLLAGQEWATEIPKVIRTSACVIVFLSQMSVSKRGYVQREYRLILDTLNEIPQGHIFLIPVLLDDCAVPDMFGRFHWIKLADTNGFERLLATIRLAERDHVAAP
jgi:hypothetical protein